MIPRGFSVTPNTSPAFEGIKYSEDALRARDTADPDIAVWSRLFQTPRPLLTQPLTLQVSGLILSSPLVFLHSNS